MKTLTCLLMIACLSFRVWSNEQAERDIVTIMKTSVRMDEYMRAMKRRLVIQSDIRTDQKRIEEFRAELSSAWNVA